MAKRLFLLLSLGLLGILAGVGASIVRGEVEAVEETVNVEFRLEEDTENEIEEDTTEDVEVFEEKSEENENVETEENSEVFELVNTEAYEEPEVVLAEESYSEPEPVYEEPVYVMPGNSIAVAGKVLEIVDVDDTMVDAGDHVNKYGDKFLYGHNSSAVFGNLASLSVGNVFTVSYNGVSTNYQVQEIVLYEKTSATVLTVDGKDYKMRAVANGRGKYEMVLMTCAGTSYGNGDASHRLVIYANAI